ncbi:hypothetical protein D9619_000606 [Psilocybe cf. subviscida]|uniref:N-acetyltransferase domain-containing protein n=1 Tax=Psilocybe cf. subviscida TaxID=2480587 RepID=A0A8H5BG87_9AGAR|nr:hypothetical protein D9619_000606 [Psilocybe cf. subviscida]
MRSLLRTVPKNDNSVMIYDDDPNTAHILLRLTPSITPIGTIRGVKIAKADSTYYKLSRLAVLKEYRKFSFGRALVETFHDWTRADALKSLPDGSDPASATATIACHSQIPVKGFYSSVIPHDLYTPRNLKS